MPPGFLKILGVLSFLAGTMIAQDMVYEYNALKFDEE
jgi:hypothetical protein